MIARSRCPQPYLIPLAVTARARAPAAPGSGPGPGPRPAAAGPGPGRARARRRPGAGAGRRPAQAPGKVRVVRAARRSPVHAGVGGSWISLILFSFSLHAYTAVYTLQTIKSSYLLPFAKFWGRTSLAPRVPECPG